MALNVNVRRDDDEGVWYVISSDVPGLHAEAASFDELVKIITDVVPDLVEANLPRHPKPLDCKIPITVTHTVFGSRAVPGDRSQCAEWQAAFSALQKSLKEKPITGIHIGKITVEEKYGD